MMIRNALAWVLLLGALPLAAETPPQRLDAATMWNRMVFHALDTGAIRYNETSADTTLDVGQQGEIATSQARRRADRWEELESTITSANDTWSSAFSWAQNALQAGQAWQEMQQAYDRLNPDDAAFDPDYSPPGMPRIPSSCLEEGREACADCFEEAYDELNFVRATLERLRAIYGATKNYSDRAIAFGDTTSGIHAVTGLAWQAEKRGIEESVAKLGRTYDEKYRGLMGTLERSLHQVAGCEARHFDQPDWYNRYGFIYYSFMEDRYRRDG